MTSRRAKDDGLVSLMNVHKSFLGFTVTKPNESRRFLSQFSRNYHGNLKAIFSNDAATL